MEKVSIREFSRRVGKSDTAIRDLISSGVITSSAITKNDNNDRPMLFFESAKKMFDDYYGNTPPKTKKVGVMAPRIKKAAINRNKKEDSDEVIPDDIPKNENKEENINSKAAIDRMRSKVQLQVALLDLKQKQGQLVDKDKVYKSLFELGQQMSQSLLAIPDKYIDNILACKTRNEAHSLLRSAISDALTQISELKESDLNFNRNTI